MPALLSELGAWVRTQKHGSVGWFDGLFIRPAPEEWSKEAAKRLRRDAFCFLTLPEGSEVVLVKTGDASPPAVGVLGSEGGAGTVANSFEEFLVRWSCGDTGIEELDDEECKKGRRALAAWLKERKVTAPKAEDFDFEAWLDCGDGKAKALPAMSASPVRKPTALMKKLGPKVRALASIIGMRADAPEVIDYVTKVLGKKPILSTSDADESDGFDVAKAGIELMFSHHILNEAYPPIRKNVSSFLPYLSHAWVRPKIGETVLGIPWKKPTEADVVKVLGAPDGAPVVAKTRTIQKRVPLSNKVLDEGASVELHVSLDESLTIVLSVMEALGLDEYPDAATGLFVAWAAIHGLLDESRFADHASLLAAVKKRKAKGTELVKAAMPRGLWSDHLIDDDELRKFAFGWFRNMGGKWITADLKKLFGKRKGPHGHDEPKLDDDTWDAVEKAAPIFTKRFAPWLK
ncbi:hypothetical protein LZC95_19515 [Pendulispora brunnea]|uniref:Uncharacterized protein n=1 Tax=Pendulispora brunnea TaxID=2905690 RepID=A0ABZ2KKD9_9BACT